MANAPAASPAPVAIAPADLIEVARRSTAALDSFAAALPQLRQLGEPRLSEDARPWQRLRRVAQRAMFRAIGPYWFQQRQFQGALLEAVRVSLERLAARDATPPHGDDEPSAAPRSRRSRPSPPQA
jgi:hypothetical protein